MDVHPDLLECTSAERESVNSETLAHVVTRAAAVITRATDVVAIVASESAIVRFMDRGRLFSPSYRVNAPPRSRAPTRPRTAGLSPTIKSS